METQLVTMLCTPMHRSLKPSGEVNYPSPRSKDRCGLEGCNLPINVRGLDKAINARLRTFATRYLKKRLAWLDPYPISVPIDALITIQRRDWRALDRRATGYRRDAVRDLAAMVTQQQEWGDLWDDVEHLRRVVEKSWKPLGQRSEWRAVRAGILRELRKKGVTQAQAQQGVGVFARSSAQGLFKMIYEPLDWWARQLEAGVATRLSALAAADIAEAVARFNTNYDNGEPRRTFAPKAIRQADAEINRLLHGLHAALRRDRRNVIRTKARQAEARAAELAGPLLNAAAYLALQSIGESNATVGRSAVDVAGAIRKALFVRSAGRMLTWKVGWPEGSSFLDSWRKAAKSKSFRSAFRAPRVTALADIARAPQTFNGKYISAEGRVGPVVILHRRGKVVSSTSLTDATGAVVQVGLPYIKLDSGGLVPGAYAHLTGTYMTRHKDFPTAVLVPDRRNLSDDSRVSWLDWLTLELLPIVTPIPHNLTAHWSWSPGSDGAGNPLTYGTWASRRRSV